MMNTLSSGKADYVSLEGFREKTTMNFIKFRVKKHKKS